MANMYITGIKAIDKGEIDWEDADIHCLLVTSSYTFDETHDFVSNITNELSGGNYARVHVDGRTVIQDDAGHRNKCDATDTTFPALGAAAGTPAKAILFVYNADDGAAQLICCCTLTTPPAPNGGDYKIVWHADGIFLSSQA